MMHPVLKPGALLALAILSSIMLASCGGGGGGSNERPITASGDPETPEPVAQSCPATFEAAGVPTQWSFTTLSEQRVSNGDSGFRTLEYVRASADQTNSYFLYFPSADPLAPVIILNEPYDGISWTDEGVDASFATLGPGRHPDKFAPAYNGQDLVRYTPETSAPDGGSLRASVSLWLESGFAIIKTYGRFYAGGTLANDVSDAVAPWYFIAARPETFAGRQVFSTGGSWGGMMALYGAAAAPEVIQPTAIAVTSPPSDLPAVRGYASELESAEPTMREEIQAFFSPYVRRINASIAVGSQEVSSAFSAETLCRCLPDRVLVAHDDADTIVPVAQTEQLQAACPEQVQPIFWKRTSPPSVEAAGLSHGDFGGRSSAPDVSTLLSAWMLSQAEVGPVVVKVDPESFHGFLSTVAAARSRGEDVSYAVAALKPLIAENIRLRASDGSSEIQTGAAFLATLLEVRFGLEITAESVSSALTADQLPF